VRHEAKRSDADLDASDKIPIVDWHEPETPTLTLQTRQAAAPPSSRISSSLMMIGAAGAVACLAAIVVMYSLTSDAPQQAIEAARPAAAASAAAPPVVEQAPAPTWVGRREATWTNDGSKTISFELQATSNVNVWMSRVRPTLVVRCLYKATEVFVAIHSAASIEGQSGNHTVRLRIDDDEEQVQQWSDSVSGQELFSPNSIALARRLATAERMRFSFTPYNATPVTAEFSVQGFETLAALVGKTCGWKLDGPTSPQIRTARLN
jgi:hypothetical protein